MFGEDGWMLALFFFAMFMDLDCVSVHKHDQYPAILTSHWVNNLYILLYAPVFSCFQGKYTLSDLQFTSAAYGQDASLSMHL